MTRAPERVLTLWRAGVAGADPARCTRERWPGSLGGPEPCVLLAAGKAAASMARAATGQLRDRLTGGVVVCPPEHVAPLAGLHPRLRVLAADHPVPTLRNMVAARGVLEAARGATGTLLVLISGGASAHLALPRDGLTLRCLTDAQRALSLAGASIEELNCVRRHAEVLKGGGLARESSASRLVTLVLSDVVGNRLDAIGSGPTCEDPTIFAHAAAILRRYDAERAAPALTSYLLRGASGQERETLKPGELPVGRVEHVIVGDNALALDAVGRAARAMGLEVLARRDAVTGLAADVGVALAREAVALARRDRPGCIIWGGETTVRVGDSPGRGGRNQELALAAAIELDRARAPRPITIGALSTDGMDGPTDAAGAVVDAESCARMAGEGADPLGALRSHDSYAVLDACGSLVRTGLTGTNVNDIAIALIEA